MRKELKRDNNPKYDDLFSGVELFESKFSLKDYKDILFGKQTPASILQKKHAPSVLKLLKGKVIEIGATTYKPFFKDFSINATEYIQTNLYPENKDILKLDAENIALDDNSVDGIVCFNVMEHIYDFNKALDEFYRVLKPGGVLVLSNPFLFPYHGAPDDYCRFTHSFYQRKLKDYKELKIYQLGNRFDTIASLLQGYEFYRLPQKRLNFLSLLSLLFMKLSEYFKKPDVYSLFYTVVATKDECNDLEDKDKEKELQFLYNKEWYKKGVESYTTAQLTLDIFKKYYMPNSVIDVGCGVGTWLKAWRDIGVEEIEGVDVNNVDNSELYIDRKNISIANLEKHDFSGYKKYDLAMSLEVAEHLDEKFAEKFVTDLTSLSDVIIFSAASPFQGGTHHVNEQPPQYWVDLFNKQGFDCFDFLRDKLMRNSQSTSWHAQNILTFVNKNKSDIFLNQELKIDNNPIFFYHPATYMDRVQEIQMLKREKTC